jgi:putative oxidoreductase
MKNLFDFISRILLAAPSLYEAYDTVASMSKTTKTLVEYGFSWHPEWFIYATSIMLAFAGILVLIGYRVGFAGTILMCYWVPVSFLIYNFWRYDIGSDLHRLTAISFMKNMAICGGLIHLIIYGSGRFAIKRLFATTHV